jgi:hypothetical protein
MKQYFEIDSDLKLGIMEEQLERVLSEKGVPAAVREIPVPVNTANAMADEEVWMKFFLYACEVHRHEDQKALLDQRHYGSIFSPYSVTTQWSIAHGGRRGGNEHDRTR